MKPVVRIIGGQFRGKKLTFPNIDGLRPTPDRVRETLFNWLMNDIHDTHCLDAFAGSGALGIEAFSRGAKEVYFIETNSVAFTHLKALVSSFNTQQLTIIHNNAIDFINGSKESFDIVFLDPPFNSNLLKSALEALEQSPILKPKGLVYIESAEEISPNPAHWRVLKQKRAGLVYYGLLQAVQK